MSLDKYTNEPRSGLQQSAPQSAATAQQTQVDPERAPQNEQADPSALGQERLSKEEDRRVAEVLPEMAAWLTADKAVMEGAPVSLQLSAELTNRADGLVNAALHLLNTDRLMTPAASALLDAGTRLTEDGDSTIGRIGWVLALNSILATPGLLDAAARNLRNRIVESDPSLAMLGPAPVATELAVPRSYILDGTIYSFQEDGGIEICARDRNRDIVYLTPREAFGLLSFLRNSGIASLIERNEAAWQQRLWQEDEADPEFGARREATAREAAFDLFMEDQELYRRIQRQVLKDGITALDKHGIPQ